MAGEYIVNVIAPYLYYVNLVCFSFGLLSFPPSAPTQFVKHVPIIDSEANKYDEGGKITNLKPRKFKSPPLATGFYVVCKLTSSCD